ncbi:hypothetical protein CIY_23070 [Butyrivibrio fibrisolvens 16/4]|nr:hypothetical protein CIY_23070 [Butyrivibrio fibrisolvens 16/4]
MAVVLIAIKEILAEVKV